jgi:hypothetical protein
MGSIEKRLGAVEMGFIKEHITAALVGALVKVEIEEMLTVLKPELEPELYGKAVRIMAEGGYIEGAARWGT